MFEVEAAENNHLGMRKSGHGMRTSVPSCILVYNCRKVVKLCTAILKIKLWNYYQHSIDGLLDEAVRVLFTPKNKHLKQ